MNIPGIWIHSDTESIYIGNYNKNGFLSAYREMMLGSLSQSPLLF